MQILHHGYNQLVALTSREELVGEKGEDRVRERIERKSKNGQIHKEKK